MPASARCSQSRAGTASAIGNRPKTSMAGRYAQPDCGSAANGAPANWNGFQPGISSAPQLTPEVGVPREVLRRRVLTDERAAGERMQRGEGGDGQDGEETEDVRPAVAPHMWKRTLTRLARRDNGLGPPCAGSDG